jgi:hypothetical protein
MISFLHTLITIPSWPQGLLTPQESAHPLVSGGSKSSEKRCCYPFFESKCQRSRQMPLKKYPQLMNRDKAKEGNMISEFIINQP